MATKKAKFKVGDRVKIRADLEEKNYQRENGDILWCNNTMCKLAGETVIITKVHDYLYNINKDDDYNWSYEMFEGLAKPKSSEEVLDEFIKIIEINSKTNNEALESIVSNFADNITKVSKSIEKISSNLNTRTIYDEEIINTIKERINKLPAEDLKDTIKSETDKYIKNNYGVLPKKIEIKNDLEVKQIEGLFHNKFEEILKIIQRGVPLMLTGPAGAGKNHTLEQVAEALDLDFYFTNAVTQEYKLTGFIDANGVYQETQFYKAFKDGGLFFLDEIDASCPEALITLNSAIANGYFDFPNGKVEANKNFRVACAGNTYGTGADMVYVGRNALDGATLDRFVTINFDYDKDIEHQLAYDDELYNFIVALRKAIKDASLRYIVSMRATINATKLLEIGIDKSEILKNVIIKNMQIDDLNVIIKKINDSSEWANLLRKLSKGI